MAKWTVQDLPPQEGRVAVVMACRNLQKAAAAAIRREVPGAKLTVMHLDLADLESVRAFAEGFSRTFDKLNLLSTMRASWSRPLRKPKTASRCSSAQTTSDTSR